MDTRSSKFIIYVVFAFVAVFPAPVLSVPVHIYGGNFSLKIVDKPGPGSEMTEAIIDVPDHFAVYDLDVRINITHTNVFDLQLFLKGPQGTRICLNYFDALTETEYDIYPNYTDTIFDDDSAVPIEQGVAPFTGSFKPRGPGKLEDFKGIDTFGKWRLQIYDMFDWDYGTLDSFELIVSVPEPATALLLTLGATLSVLLRPRRT